MKKYSRKIPSDVGIICDVVRDVINYLQHTCGPIDDCTVFELQVMINELLVNAIKHGNKEDKLKQVQISAGLTKNKSLIFCIEDEGIGYDYKKQLQESSDSCMELDVFDMKETGRGLQIVKNLSNKLKFNHQGNRVLVLKKIK